MSSVLNKCFLNHKIYFIYNIKKIELYLKHRFNKTNTAALRNIIK